MQVLSVLEIIRLSVGVKKNNPTLIKVVSSPFCGFFLAAGFELNYCHVISFPVLGSQMLLIMFYYFQYLQLVYMFLSVGKCKGLTIYLGVCPTD